MKILKSLLLILVTLFLCTGCSGDNFNSTIMLVTQNTDFNDNGYSHALWADLQHFALQTRVLTLANPDDKPLLDVVTTAVQQKPGLLFISSDADSNPELEPLVKQHPEITFVMLDKQEAFIQPNYMAVWVKSNEGAFLAGYLAGRMTTTGKVGFVGGIESASIDRFKYGYLAGVAYAGQERGQKITVDARMAGTYVSQGKGAWMGGAMYDAGCDIIFCAAGETGLGVFQEAAQKNKYVIGVDVDQQDLSPEHVLASALSDYSVVIRQVTDMYLNRERMRPPADTGLHSRATGLALNERLVPYNVTRSINRIKELVEASRTLETAHGRSIRVPDNEASYQEFLKQL